MLWLVLLLIAESESVQLLQPNSTSTCPGSVVSLECSEAEGLLEWAVVALRDEQELWRINYDDSSPLILGLGGLKCPPLLLVNQCC